MNNNISLVVPFGPVQFFLEGLVDFSNLDVDIHVYVKGPFLLRANIGRFKGNLRNSLSLSNGPAGILTMYTGKGMDGCRWAYMKVLGTKCNFDTKLFPFPF
ncbi:hypothetical protein BC835DRAFT_1370315 [Cytidiella melzeri]|nr:hypothetical protein BC835DRAFT_1370315 [Cytidiella melzeri]